MPTVARSSACRRIAIVWSACCRFFATPSSPALHRERSSANNDYKQLSSAAIAGDVAMFLGGNWQIKELKDALPPDEFAKWGIAPIPQLARRHGADRYRRMGLGRVLAGSRKAARGR